MADQDSWEASLSLLNALHTGASGLDAASHAIDVTSHNVANAMTDGYHRRSVQQSIAQPMRRGTLWIGSGAKVDAVLRSADHLLSTQIVSQTGVSTKASVLQQSLSVVEPWYDEDDVVTLLRPGGGGGGSKQEPVRVMRRAAQRGGHYPVGGDSDTATTFSTQRPPCTCTTAEKEAARRALPSV